MLCSNFVQFNPHLAGREDNVCGVVPNRLFVALVNATKIQSLRGISRTAPYFHDHSARTLEEVMEHYVKIFELHFRGQNEGLTEDCLSRMSRTSSRT